MTTSVRCAPPVPRALANAERNHRSGAAAPSAARPILFLRKFLRELLMVVPPSVQLVLGERHDQVDQAPNLLVDGDVVELELLLFDALVVELEVVREDL